MRLRIEPIDPPDMPMYTAPQLLECPMFMSASPCVFDSAEEASFWRTFEAHLLAWLREEVGAGRIEDPEPAKFGAWSLLSHVAAGTVDADGMECDHFQWSHLSAEDLLFNGLVHGLMPGWDVEVAVDGLASFASYLGNQGIVDRRILDRLGAELRVWGPKFVAELAPHANT